MAALRQVVRSGFCKPGFCVSAHSGSGTSRLSNYRQISKLAEPNVDTSALLRSLEAQGIPPKQAGAIIEVLKQAEMMQESNLSKFKSELKSCQEHHFSLLQLETEKLRADIEKMRSESRCEPEEVTAVQRPELDVEIRHIRDELANQSAETNKLTDKLVWVSRGLNARFGLLQFCAFVYIFFDVFP